MDTAKARRASCTCGQLSVVTHGEPAGVSVCHCLACQQRSGSVFATQARFLKSAVTVAGASTTYVRVGDGGSRATFHFCATCAGTVFFTSDARDDSIMIPVGAFADPHFPAPTFSVYEERMHDWVQMPADIEHMD
jgi:hypothetical protein